MSLKNITRGILFLIIFIFSTVNTAFSQYDGAYFDGAYDGGYDATYDAPYPAGNCATRNSTDVPKTIPNPGTVSSAITVPSTAALSNVGVKNLNITHSYDPDLDVYLISPNGTTVELFTDVGENAWFGGGANFTGTALSQLVSNSITTGYAPFSGTYRPEGNLGTLNGQNGTGVWTLRITDDSFSWFEGSGSLNSWSLELCTAPSTPTPSPSPSPGASPSGTEVYRYQSGSSWQKVSAPTPGEIIAGGTGSINTVQSMVEFNGNLIAGTYKPGQAEVYSYNGTIWTKISQPTPGQLAAGGTTGIDGFTALTVYNNQLYVGTITRGSQKAEVYRYNGGTSWTRVSSSTPGTIMTGGTTNIDSIYSMAVFNNRLYVGTRRARIVGGSQAFGEGAEIYAYDSTTSTWSKVSAATPGVIDPLDSTKRFSQVDSMEAYNGALYSAAAAAGGLVIYRYNGSAWTTVSQSTPGQIATGGTTGISNAFSMHMHNNELYIGANGGSASGWNHTAEVYRYNGGTSWTKVSQSTPGQIATGGTTGIDLVPGMATYNLALYIGVEKLTGGALTYRYDGGTTWTLVSSSPGRITSGGTTGIDGVWSLANYAGNLYSGTEVETVSAPIPTPTSSATCTTTGGASGGILIDSLFNNCSSGTTNYTGPASFTLNDSGGGVTGSIDIPAVVNGTYTVQDSSCSGQRFLTISGIGNSTAVRSVSIDNGPFLPNNLSGPFTTQGFTYPGPNSFRTIKWCLIQGGSWFQTDTGDVRMPNLVNQIFKDGQASTDPNFPGIFISSQGDPNFGGFTPSVKNWKVGREYSYNDDFKKGLGGVSYSFYASQAKTRGIPIETISGGSINPASLSSGVYQTSGDTTIAGGIIPAGRHIVLLVNGTATVNGNVTSSPANGNLFIVAAKGSIDIPDTVTAIDGIYTAEKSINILSRANCAGAVSDSALTVRGALISNSLYPFETGQGGQVKNNRDLCAANTTTPSLVVTARPDFLTQMTDFYKTTYKTFREVEP